MSAIQGMFHSVPFLSSYDRVSWLQSGEVDCWRKVIGGEVRVPLTKNFGRLHAVSREQVSSVSFVRLEACTDGKRISN